MPKRPPDSPKARTPRESADYIEAILLSLKKMAEANSQDLLAHLLGLAAREASYLAKP